MKRKKLGGMTIGAIVALGIVVLFRIGNDFVPALTDWWELRQLASELSDANPRIASNAEIKLQARGPDTSPIFLTAMHDPKPATRLLACQGLRHVETRSEVLDKALREALEDRDQGVRINALSYFGSFRYEDASGTSIDPALTAVLACLNDPSELIRIAAASALRRMAIAPPLRDDRKKQVAIGLLAALADPIVGVRTAAANGLKTVALASPFVLEGLDAALDDPHPDVRAASALALLQLGTETNSKAISTLATLIAEYGYVPPGTTEIVAALHEAGEQTEGAFLKDLIDRFRSEKHVDNRYQIAQTLMKMGSRARQAVPVLLEQIDSLKALAGLNLEPTERGKPAIDNNLSLRCHLATTVLCVQEERADPRAIGAILDAMLDPAVRFYNRSEGVTVLCQIDHDAYATKILPAICRRLGSEHQAERFAAHDLLMLFKPGVIIDLDALFDKPLKIKHKELPQ